MIKLVVLGGAILYIFTSPVAELALLKMGARRGLRLHLEGLGRP